MMRAVVAIVGVILFLIVQSQLPALEQVIVETISQIKGTGG